MPSAIVIRLLTPADAAAFQRARLEQVELEPTAFGESPDEIRARTTAAVAERLGASRDEAFVIGAFANGRLVGTAGYFRRAEAKSRHKGRVWGVFVLPAFRGLGLGRMLMRELIAEAKKISGLEQLDLAVGAAQKAARQLYESLGFSKYGCEARALKIGAGYVDEDLMVFRLPNPQSLSRSHLLAIPHAHAANHIPLLDLIHDLHAGHHAAEHGVLRVEMRLR